jgi:hypothetical protein
LKLDPELLIKVIVNQFNSMYEQTGMGPQKVMPRDEEEHQQYAWLVTSIFMLRVGIELQRQRSVSSAQNPGG